MGWVGTAQTILPIGGISGDACPRTPTTGLGRGKLLAERRAEDFNARFNLIDGRGVGGGSSDEWDYGYAARALWTIDRRFQFGVEGFGEFSSDAHAWGARAGVTFGPATFSVGYLRSFGADAEADRQVRLSLELSP